MRRTTLEFSGEGGARAETEKTMDRLNILSRGLTLMPWTLVALAATFLIGVAAVPSYAQDEAQYPPLSEYLIPRDAEIALARSAAPANISDRATIKVLTESGYDVASEGDNGFVCMVLRGWSAPTYTPAQFLDLV